MVQTHLPWALSWQVEASNLLPMRACFMRLQREDLAEGKYHRLHSPGAISTGLLIRTLGQVGKKWRPLQRNNALYFFFFFFLSFWTGFFKPKGSKSPAVLNVLLLLSPASNNSLQHGLSRLILDLNWEVTGRLQEGGLLAKQSLPQWTLFKLNVENKARLVTFAKPSSSNQVAKQIRLWDHGS